MGAQFSANVYSQVFAFKRGDYHFRLCKIGKSTMKKYLLSKRDDYHYRLCYIMRLMTEQLSETSIPFIPGCVAQSVMWLATGASLTADPGVASSILAQSHTIVEIDCEIISTVILLPSAESFKRGCCQLQVKVCA